MSRRSSQKVSMAPMAVTSDGTLLVNALQLTATDDLATAVESARATGLDVFVGVVVPSRLRRPVLRDIDDALADVVGRVGPKLIDDRWSASSRSSGGRASSSPDRRSRRVPRPRGRRPAL